MKLCRAKAPVRVRTTDNSERPFDVPTCGREFGHEGEHVATECDYMVQITWEKKKR